MLISLRDFWVRGIFLYNVNPGQNKELKCRVLEEYTAFVETVRKHVVAEEEFPIENAIRECIQNHILETFLEKYWTEVVKSMTIDMTFERREQLIREEERIYGREEGREEGASDLISNALRKGRTCEEIAEFLGIPIVRVTEVKEKMDH